jgi:N-acetylglucosamine transport system permease protein
LKVLTRLLLALLTLSVFLPLVWTMLSSVKAGSEILGSPWGLPAQIRMDNYGRAWNEAGIGRAFVNSAIVTVCTLVILLPIGSMAAYVLAKYTFPGSKLTLTAFLTGMMFPHFLVVVPLFLMLRDLQILDTLFGLVVVYVAYSLAFTIFVLTGFFQSLPDELGEAAMLDGCGHAATFWHVMLPLARPGIVVVGLFNAIGLWNEYGLALVLLPGEANRTLPLGIANLTMTQQYQSDWGALFAGLVIVMAPVFVAYWVFRERIHETMLAGAIK